jgi:hypothetical protein
MLMALDTTAADDQIVYLNGAFMPMTEARIPVLDRGFIFGDGVYEVIPVYKHTPFRLPEHLRRLQYSLDGIRLQNPYSEPEWTRLIRELVARCPDDDQSLYLQVTRGVAKRDHAFPKDTPPTVFMMTNALSSPPAEAIANGVSTGLPTKTEQADLFQALFGRNSETPVPVLAPATPGDCFWIALEASRIAIKYMVPVIVLSDGYLANGAEPWRIPEVGELPEIPVVFRTDPSGFRPYAREPHTLARPWAVPGTAGLEHRVGGLEKQDVTGNVSYDPLNHETMVRLRAAKVQAVLAEVPDASPAGDAEGELLVVGWGSTQGAITAAVRAQRERGRRIGPCSCVT